MKINMSFPATGCQKLIEIADELKVRPFYEKRMGQEVDADTLGDEFKGYVVRITGGCQDIFYIIFYSKLNSIVIVFARRSLTISVVSNWEGTFFAVLSVALSFKELYWNPLHDI